jgi:hypothetical protein
MTHLPRLLAAVGALALVGACTSSARGFCEADADCDREFFGVAIDSSGDADDSVDVCTVNQEGFVRALRANEEEECQVAADKFEVLMACIAAEFADDNDGCDVLESKCEDERDDVNDAFGDIDGNECSSNED